MDTQQDNPPRTSHPPSDPPRMARHWKLPPVHPPPVIPTTTTQPMTRHWSLPTVKVTPNTTTTTINKPQPVFIPPPVTTTSDQPMKMKRHWKLRLKSVNFQSGGALPTTTTSTQQQQVQSSSKPPSPSAAIATTSQQQQQQVSSKNTKKGAPPPISSSSVGYKLLQKAGWKEGSAIGAQQQGLLEPLQATVNLGTSGIGYIDVDEQDNNNKNSKKKKGGSKSKNKKRGKGKGGSYIGNKRRKINDWEEGEWEVEEEEEEEEDIDTKVKRVRQVMQTEADEQYGKEISQYIYRSFKQDGCSGIGEQTADDNPLLRKGRNRLTLTNPLL